MSESNVVRLSFSIEAELNDRFETLVRENGFQNRSEYIRDMIRKQLARRRCAGDGEMLGTVSVVFDPRRRGVSEAVTAAQQHAPVAVLAVSRVFAAPGACAEMVMVRGVGSRIRGFADSLRRLRGVSQVEFVITSPETVR